MTGPRLCTLHLSVGREEACPGAACLYWDDSGPGFAPGCAIERLPLELRRPDLAEYLLDLRATLEDARSCVERDAPEAAVAQLVPPDLGGR